MLQGGTMRFSEIAQAVPALSDRLLSERMKELEARGIVERRVGGASPARVEYELTAMGRDLAPALAELEAWAHRWLESSVGSRGWITTVPRRPPTSRRSSRSAASASSASGSRTSWAS